MTMNWDQINWLGFKWSQWIPLESSIQVYVTAGPIELERDLKFRKVDDDLALTMAARSVARHRVDSAGST